MVPRRGRSIYLGRREREEEERKRERPGEIELGQLFQRMGLYVNLA